MKNSALKKLVLSAMFLAIGIILPFFTGQIPQVGKMLLPMHLPVFFCGLICGWQYGLAVGLVLPVMRSAMFTMPVMFPTAIAMSFELAAYGAVAGFLYNRSKWQCIIALYRSLIIAMLAGRLVWGAVQAVLLGVSGNAFTLSAFFAGAFTTAIPGIILQLVFIPAVMVALDRTGLVRFRKAHKAEVCAEK